jgi:hypothetical protein
MLRNSTLVAILFGFLSLGVLFQNCTNSSRINFTDVNSKLSLASDSGNGTGYGGKIPGIYYHYVPGYRCENHESAFAKLEYTPSQKESIYDQSKESACLSIPISVDNALIDSGSMQNKVVGFEEKILEEGKANSTSIPSQIVEIWCVDQWVNPTVEILSVYNESSKQAQTDFYYPSMAKRTELNPARTTAFQSVHLTSNYFDLVVDKSQLGLKAGTYQGHLNILNGSHPKQTLQCRLGGYLDARLWPAMAVNYDNSLVSEWSPTDKLFYISSGLSGMAPFAENKLYTYSPLSNSKKMIIENVASKPGVSEFQFTPDRSKLLMKASLVGDIAAQLYSKVLNDLSPPVLLNNRLTEMGQGISGPINVSPDSRYIYYQDGAQQTGGNIGAWLRVVDSNTGNITQVNQNLNAANEEVRGFDTSYSLGKVVYTTGLVYVDLWISDLFGGNRRKIDLSNVLGVNPSSGLGGTNFYLDWAIQRSSRWLFINERYLVLVAANSTTMYSTMVFVVDVQSEKIIFSKEFSGPASIFAVKDLAVVGISTQAIDNNTIETYYINLNTASLGSAQDIINAYRNSTQLQEKRAALNLEVSISIESCPRFGETKIHQISLDSSTWLVVNRSAKNVASIYLKTIEDSSCVLVNKLNLPTEVVVALDSPLSNYYSPGAFSLSSIKAQISEDRKNILLGLYRRLYLVPTQRQTIIEIYTASNVAPKIEVVGFVDNSKVYFKGSLITDNWSQVFIWNLPTLP